MKTKDELNQLKKEYEALNNKLKELSEDELKEVSGGLPDGWIIIDSSGMNLKII